MIILKMHIPVLQKEVIEYLHPQPNENFIDATFGLGGHSKEILERIAPNGKVLGIEIDSEIYKKISTSNLPPRTLLSAGPAGKQFPTRLILVNDSYTNLKEIVEKYNFRPVQGILFDLGMSSWHLEKSGRGFSFQKDEPLDMRYQGAGQGQVRDRSLASLAQCQLTAEKIVNKWPQKEIEKILREYGEERFAKKIAERIIKERKIKPIETTFQLVKIIERAVPRKYHLRKIHIATKTFQALRIAVNDELENLRKALPQTIEVLNSGGRLVVISFHSLEDRIVKNFLRNEEKNKNLQILTKKPVTATLQEVQENHRSRSAKLRAAIKLV